MTSPCCEKDERTPAQREDPAPCCGTGAPADQASACCDAARPESGQAEPCCGPEVPGRPAPYRKVPVEGRLSTLAGDVPRVSSRWGLGDWIGRVLVRLGFQRMSYLAFANITEILGIASTLATCYRQKASIIAGHINARFMDASGAYRVGQAKRKGKSTQTGQGMALCNG